VTLHILIDIYIDLLNSNFNLPCKSTAGLIQLLLSTVVEGTITHVLKCIIHSYVKSLVFIKKVKC